MSLPGNPMLLLARVADLHYATERLSTAERMLADIHTSGRAESLVVAREQTRELRELIEVAHERYAGTGAALEHYGYELRVLHDRADEVQARTTAVRRELEAQPELDAQTRGELTRAALEANLELVEYRQQVNVAAERAIEQIHDVLVHLDEGFFDRLVHWNERAGAFLSSFDEWVDRVFADAWSSLQRIVLTVNNSMVVTNTLLLGAVTAGILHPFLGLVALHAIAMIAGLIMVSVITEALKPTPKVTKLEHAGASRVFFLGEVLLEAQEVDELSSPDSPLRTNPLPDGSDTESVVKITKIVDASGAIRWRVALPSTQEWLTQGPWNDFGLTNDLDSNLTVMITPMLQSQYERAVLQALHSAGVQPDEPIMLVGFSQGGLVAGHLAAFNNDYTWDAIVVAGAPIDHLPIPKSTSVVSVQHAGDPVHQLDVLATGRGAPVTRPHWITVERELPGAPLGDIHNVDTYAGTLEQEHERVVARFTNLEPYFTSSPMVYGEVEQYYRWQE